MNRKDITRLCSQAIDETKGVDSPLFRFAALVAAAEREACAVVAEKLGVHPALNVYNGGPEWYKHGKEIALKIRARGRNE
jgi:hypothetical protein